MITPLRWAEDRLLMLDQRGLPHREEWLELSSAAEVAEAIRDMAVRGAPAIGISAAYGMALSTLMGGDWERDRETLFRSRPTAVNLVWALTRLDALPDRSFARVLEEAKAIEKEDLEMNLAIGRNGAELVPRGANILTICNTGALATAGHGTALGLIRSAHAQGNPIHVWSCETRPRQQGLRLTAYELQREGIPFCSIADSTAAVLMRQRKVDLVIAGADRIARNGDTANKIGTYMLAVLAHHHEIPFYIAAPSSTWDLQLASGDDIHIEERGAEELTHIEGVRIAPEGCNVFNPAFDVTPGTLISGIVNELGVHRPPYRFSAGTRPELISAQ